MHIHVLSAPGKVAARAQAPLAYPDLYFLTLPISVISAINHKQQKWAHRKTFQNGPNGKSRMSLTKGSPLSGLHGVLRWPDVSVRAMTAASLVTVRPQINPSENL